jgi:16S rRNA (cytosine967-C5)-methyltransferase
MVFGVVRWQATLDWLIARKTEPGRNQKTGLRILLRLGLYQLFWLDRVPDHAAVHETVALARHQGFGAQSGFVNALLRGYSRERDSTRQLLADLKQKEPHLGWSHPEWLCERWRERWGRIELERLLEWNNTPPPTFARINTLRTDAAALLPRWRDEDVQYDFFTRDWAGENLIFELKSHPPLASLPSFREGAFYVQDPSTLLAVRELAPQPGETILDLCAAPGGKTTWIAQLMENRGRLAAQDLNRQRLERLRANCERLGVSCAEFTCNSGIAVPELTARVDRVLVDVPCSNTGVLRRRVDLRWRIRPEEIARLRSAQLELLQDGAHQTRAGGILVYSTCSLEPEENHEVVTAFLAANPDFRLERERQLLPFRDGVDGAYVATLTRTA